MNRLERIINYVAPGVAKKRAAARTETIRQEKIAVVLNQGYGSHGASRTKKSMSLWNPNVGDADSDIHNYLEELRARSRDLAVGGAIVAGAHKTMRTNVVGTGLRLKPAFDKDFLNLTAEQSATLKSQIDREWSLWADSKNCDAAGLNDFYGLQQLAFLSQLQSGDVFGLLPMIKRPFSVYDLKVNLIEADRCSSPNLSDTDRIQSGVEVDETGMIVAYHFSSRHPGSGKSYLGGDQRWTRVLSRGEETGRYNVLHLMESERPGQRRGVPVIAPVIEALKQLDRYTEAELTAAAIQAMFTVFIETENADDPSAFGLKPPDTDNLDGEELPSNDIKLGAGAVQFLEPGEKANFANPTRPNPNFDPFVTAILRQIGSALEIPYEMLVKHFTSSYSASRAALLEAWKMFRMRRTWLAKSFCQPIYEEWFVEAVTKGRIDAPGIFSDPAIFRAYTKATWHGPSQGMLDPVKEVNAAILRVENMFSTRAAETSELTGGEWEAIVQQQQQELELLKRLGLSIGSASPAPTAETTSSNVGDEEDDSDDLEGGEKENAQEDQG
ncbi:phage portal protein [Paenibacillus kribbensis]|uniref:phage portal protein n=1 Tax=Paenibacillus kribbensis TaxID=172713 RepID=UPI002DC012E8|nr:phage portal protein [Paenibacillus kribbensis]MEC0237743.1 phage portal protein [Paenibacillus kribbensis]